MSETDSSTAPAETGTPSPLIPASEQLVHEEPVEFGGPSELVVTVVEAVAAVRDRSPADLLPVVQESVDADGLERVFRAHPSASNRRGWVTFFFRDCRIVLHSDGLLQVFDRRAEA